ncbi:hypothetical protein [Paenibacillus sp. USDA918EY]|uniref:hypothetical protein n=1 Tax=Paenibacillus sp. USDA918EY TaxID=2689575 RepID=UPI00135983CC|nr:hypothetical protein [Paenibacillus sp. USDA918EY]
MKRKLKFNIHYERAGTDEQAAAIIKSIAKRAIQEVLNKHGAVAHNLDEVLDKYIRPTTLRGRRSHNVKG